MTIDLHIHSTYSDGTKSPAEIVALANKTGLEAISLTDHDTMSGTKEMLEAGKKFGINVLPGLELSVVHDGIPLHILGYCIDENDENLCLGLKEIQHARDDRNRKIINKLIKLGFPVTVERLEKLSGHGQAGRPHIGAMLVQLGAVKNINQAFQLYLRKGKCGYVARSEFKAEAAIKMIKNAGGLSILAHPVQFDASLRDFPALLKKLLAIGIDGVEMYYPTQSSSFRKKLYKITKQYDLIYTAGSDYHGDVRQKTSLGLKMAAGVGTDMIRKLIGRLNGKKCPD